VVAVAKASVVLVAATSVVLVAAAAVVVVEPAVVVVVARVGAGGGWDGSRYIQAYHIHSTSPRQNDKRPGRYFEH
jgi:hypothetical protein